MTGFVLDELAWAGLGVRGSARRLDVVSDDGIGTIWKTACRIV